MVKVKALVLEGGAERHSADEEEVYRNVSGYLSATGAVNRRQIHRVTGGTKRLCQGRNELRSVIKNA